MLVVKEAECGRYHVSFDEKTETETYPMSFKFGDLNGKGEDAWFIVEDK